MAEEKYDGDHLEEPEVRNAQDIIQRELSHYK